MKQNIQITAYTAISALGFGNASMVTALKDMHNGLKPCDFQDCDLITYIGSITELDSVQPFPEEKLSRNNKIAYATLQQDGFAEQLVRAIAKYGADRIGLIVGTSTSGFKELEHAYQQRAKTGKLPDDFDFNATADLYATTDFIQQHYAITGPSMTINTACSSSAKAIISATRWLANKFCDAVVVIGADSLCLNTLYGFNSLELLDKQICQPCGAARHGLNIGEAGAALLLERSDNADKPHILGYGESSDGYHMSAPHPEGVGAVLAMQQALQTAQLNPEDIDYINMHGTASKMNDAIEDHAIYQVFADKTPCSSTKGLTGHTLGAAGALEVVLSCLALELNLLPGCSTTKAIDPSFNSKILLTNKKVNDVKFVLSNAFGFGGNNCSIIIGASDAS